MTILIPIDIRKKWLIMQILKIYVSLSLVLSCEGYDREKIHLIFEKGSKDPLKFT